jgi:hypothetical protein
MSNPVAFGPWLWWGIIVLFNLAQVAVCLYYVLVQRPKSSNSGDLYSKRMLVLGCIFTFVALYRSVFVSRYLMQYAWFDTILNSSLIIRSLAVLAEMSFALLFAMAMLKFERDLTPVRPVGKLYRLLTLGPKVLVISLLLAQFFAYGGLIFKSRLSFAIEETLWMVGFLSILPLSLIQLKRVWSKTGKEYSSLKISARIIAAWSIIYSIYSIAFHLPIEYWASAIEQLETNIPQIKTGWTALSDSLVIVNVTRDLGDWGFGFAFWHTAYFTVCVWISLVLMRAPRKRHADN